MITATYSNKCRLLISDNQIIVHPASIDSSHAPAKPLRLLLDTGAFITMLSKETAEEYGYPIWKERDCAIAGFSEKGLLCDLRKIPTLVFNGHVIEDVVIATPHHDNILVDEVLGMNILENFHIGLDFSTGELFTRAREDFISQKPKYKCGRVRVISESDIPPTAPQARRL